MSPATTTTVKFNVGGMPYEVSRSLLEQHPQCMMTRMASDLWNSSGEEDGPLFIERNGNRFQYVLDYMRDGKVTLSGGQITKSVIMEELLYFGFLGVNPDAIEVAFDVFSMPDQIAKIEKECDIELAELEKRKEELEIEIACKTVARACAVRHIQSGDFTLEFSIIKQRRPAPDGAERFALMRDSPTPENRLDFQVAEVLRKKAIVSTKWKDHLNKALAKYGLRRENGRTGVTKIFPDEYGSVSLEAIGAKIHVAPLSNSVPTA